MEERSALSVPCVLAQQTLLETVYSRSGVPVDAIAYIEAHGTGTRRGDEAEWQALAKFVDGKRKSPLLIGSVKANIGHSEGAAGIAGLIKVALCAHYGIIPATIHVAQERFSSSDIAVCTACTNWPRDCGVAGVTSLGLNGTNCHLTIERVTNPRTEKIPAPPPWLFVLSAHTRTALIHYADALLRWAKDWRDIDLPHVCYTAAVRREHQLFRHAFVCSSIGQFVEELRFLVNGLPRSSAVPGRIEPTLRAFQEGQAVRWETVFRESLLCVSLPPFPWQRERASPGSIPKAETDGARIRSIIADVLRLPDHALEEHRSLIDLGLESLSAVELERRLTEEFGVQLDAMSFLEALSVNDLIRLVQVSHASGSHS
jgi:acyl transferase domain-containing protein/acyl carrier protein